MEITNEFEEEFKKLNVSVNYIPKSMQIKNLRREIKELTFTTAKMYNNFLIKECEFWKNYK